MLLEVQIFNYFIRERKRKFYFLNNVGLDNHFFFFHFSKLVHVLNNTENIILTNKLVRMDCLTNFQGSKLCTYISIFFRNNKSHLRFNGLILCPIKVKWSG